MNLPSLSTEDMRRLSPTRPAIQDLVKLSSAELYVRAVAEKIQTYIHRDGLVFENDIIRALCPRYRSPWSTAVKSVGENTQDIQVDQLGKLFREGYALSPRVRLTIPAIQGLERKVPDRVWYMDRSLAITIICDALAPQSADITMVIESTDAHSTHIDLLTRVREFYNG